VNPSRTYRSGHSNRKRGAARAFKQSGYPCPFLQNLRYTTNAGERVDEVWGQARGMCLHEANDRRHYFRTLRSAMRSSIIRRRSNQILSRVQMYRRPISCNFRLDCPQVRPDQSIGIMAMR